MTGPNCGGQLEPGRTTSFVTLSPGVYLVVENVPALVCQRCGEGFTDSEPSDVMLRLVQRLRDSLPAGGRAKPTYDFREAHDLAASA